MVEGKKEAAIYYQANEFALQSLALAADYLAFTLKIGMTQAERLVVALPIEV